MNYARALQGVGRGGRIRTYDLLVPNLSAINSEPRTVISMAVPQDHFGVA